MSKKPLSTAKSQQTQQAPDLQFAQNETATPRAASPETVDASACLPNQECPLTAGCRGRLQTFNTVSMAEQNAAGETVNVKYQQLRCTKCGRMPTGARRVSAPSFSSKLFNRLTAQAE